MNKHIFAFIAGICLTTSVFASNENAQQQVTTSKKISPVTALIRTINDHAYLIAGIHTLIYAANVSAEAFYLMEHTLCINPRSIYWYKDKGIARAYVAIVISKTVLTGAALKFFSSKILTYLEQSENN